ncbi:hypothetical protein Q428_02540 [Fervidicella metallireducens AeB]|uniref:Uncharacterized protein n=1 Tax=Fervidicella metallireducens AeB TaxID=1403537 RepID=A0A017RYN1_9CLOT|nr:hypothetical protein [Fervidicella metallireducens]EYE89504.1 hypothetical protein Q428_02540 [Fervidicella metallireducens AeB]
MKKNRFIVIINLTIFLSIFVINNVVRMSVASKIAGYTKYSALINLLFLCSFGLLFINRLVKRKINFIRLFFIILFSIYFIYNIINSSNGEISSVIQVITSYIIPVFLLSFIYDKDEYNTFVPYIIRAFNYYTVFILIYGLIDYGLKYSLQNIFINYTYYDMARLIQIEQIMGIYRLYSIFGGPLYNAYVFILYFILNNIFRESQEKVTHKSYTSILILIIGIVISGSKTGLIIAAALLIFIYKPKNYRFSYYIILLLIGVAVYKSSLFQDNLMQRFMYKSFGSGRNELLKELLTGNYELPKFILGKGLYYSKTVAKYIGVMGMTNFEYPIIMLSYDYGIITTLLIYLIIFITPLIKILRTGDYKTAVLFLMLHVFINGFNALADINDLFAQLIFIQIIILKAVKFTSLSPCCKEIKQKGCIYELAGCN